MYVGRQSGRVGLSTACANLIFFPGDFPEWPNNNGLDSNMQGLTSWPLVGPLPAHD